MNMKKIKIDGIENMCFISIIDKMNIKIKVIDGINFKMEREILKFMYNYIVDELNDGEIDIREYNFNSKIFYNGNLVFNLKVLDEYC